jgi:N-glycosylase/DNA lyase
LVCATCIITTKKTCCCARSSSLPAVDYANPTAPATPPRLARRKTFAVSDYDLAATLSSGQAFHWHPAGDAWTGVIGPRWVCLSQQRCSLVAETAEPVSEWSWLTNYLQLHRDLGEILGTFPNDAPMREAVAACRGLRLLRQDPWECLASFILSSTKQIVQIQQIVATLCERFGEPVTIPPGEAPRWAFPTPARLAEATETELRACKMGFRAPYLLAAARRVASGELNPSDLAPLPLETARARLTELAGVGRKIADCVLLFGCGFDAAFPVDVWVMRALRQLYFPRRRVTPRRMLEFTTNHFGPHAGFAQQYLFHYIRTRAKPSPT